MDEILNRSTKIPLDSENYLVLIDDVRSCIVSNSGKYFIAMIEERVMVYDLETRAIINMITIHGLTYAAKLLISPDDRFCAVEITNHVIYWFELLTSKLITSIIDPGD